MIRQPAYQLHGNPGFLRSAWTGGNYNALGLPADNFVDGNLIVAMHFERTTQFAQVLGQVVGERIVVVQQQNHGRLASFPFFALCAVSKARNKALDLFTDSSNSPWGVESATIPPPACMCATPFLMTIVRRAMHESRLPAKSRYKIPPA